jgi:YVTN family beta-propeller protein
VTLPDVAEEERGAPSHGIGVSPDDRSVWATSRMNSHVYVYSPCPDLELLASVAVGADPDWITFTPDGGLAYVANAESNTVTAIDTKTFDVAATIPVGEAPKRYTWIRLRQSAVAPKE